MGKIKFITENPTLIVGVDVAKKRHYARMFDIKGYEVDKGMMISNNRMGFEQFLLKLKEIKERDKFKRIVVGLEPTGPYWLCFANYLIEHRLHCVLVNPCHVRRYREIEWNSPNKVDPKDAAVVASLLRQGKFNFLNFQKGTYADLRELNTFWESLNKDLRRTKNRIRNLITRYFPEYEEIFKDIFSKTSLCFLEKIFFPEEVVKIGLNRLRKILKEGSNNRVGKNKIEKIYELASRSVGLREAKEIAKIEMEREIKQLKILYEEMKIVREKIKIKLSELEEAKYLSSIPNINSITVAGFIGQVGDASKYDTSGDIIKLAGFDLVENSSGEKKGEKHISKRGKPILRAVAYRAALSCVGRIKNGYYRNPALGQYYDFLIEKLKMNKIKALTAVAIKLLKIMFILAKNREYFDPIKANPYIKEIIERNNSRADGVWNTPIEHLLYR